MKVLFLLLVYLMIWWKNKWEYETTFVGKFCKKWKYNIQA